MLTTWTKEELIEAVKNSHNYMQVSKALKLKNLGSNIRTIKKYVKLYSLDTSHFYTMGEQIAYARSHVKVLTFEEMFTQDSTIDRKHIKNYAIKHNLLPYKCNCCGLDTWNDKPISLHLDHINGVNNDHRLTNLQFLCPNCHAQTPTYCRGPLKEPNRCIDCNCAIISTSKRCQVCESKQRRGKKTKITWLPKTELVLLVEEHGYEHVGRLLGVSGNAVKKHIRNN